MEEHILKTLDYRLTYPTPYTFLKRFMKGSVHEMDDGVWGGGGADGDNTGVDHHQTLEKLACMILDSTLLFFHKASKRYLPSQLAAGSIILARHTLFDRMTRHRRPSLWNQTYESLSSYNEDKVVLFAKDIFRCYYMAINHEQLRSLGKKYSKSKYGKVSSIEVLSLHPVDDDESSWSEEEDY